MDKELSKFCEQNAPAALWINDTKVAGHIGSFIAISKYRIELEHKNYLIEIDNELGNHNLGSVRMDLHGQHIPSFKISTRNHFLNLLTRKKEMLKISTNDYVFKSKIEQAIQESKLEEIAQKNSFEPEISLKSMNGQPYLETIYSLQFEDKIGGLQAIVDFYKLMVS
jgi:hypothetical protein